MYYYYTLILIDSLWRCTFWVVVKYLLMPSINGSLIMCFLTLFGLKLMVYVTLYFTWAEFYSLKKRDQEKNGSIVCKIGQVIF